MPPRSTIETLPPEIREIIESELIAANFSGYAALTERVAARVAEAGLDVVISKSALNRFGADLKAKYEKLRERQHMAKLFNRELGDDEGAMNNLTIQFAQDRLFEMVADEELDDKQLARVSGAIADLARANVIAKKHLIAVRKQVEKAAEEVAKDARDGGLSDDAADAIRRKVLGIVPKEQG